ncbi:MAG: CocE/NonD family hydrolase, partial [Emcibacteraceae bacterium]|nr:CocE/NonD family hydrolase [Emcibacteraceae bacterium]
MQNIIKSFFIIISLMLLNNVAANASDGDYDLKANYTKHEYNIPMRDGTHLFTSVYTPKEGGATYPILLKRTPYSLRPYGVNNYPNYLGPNGGDNRFAKDGYIFVYQDVRGKNMSEGDFRNMTPHNDNKTGTEHDESSDTYDTVEWLLTNVKNHNGKVGLFGISYPGFYTAASIIDTHPAIKAASPQAPMGDIYIGDDFHHQGAFFMLDAFRFFRGFDQGPKNPTQESATRFQFPHDDSYQFFLELGALSNVNDKIFHGKSPFWNNLMEHGDYDEFWQSRAIAPHLNNITANVMTVIGSYDAEDSYGGTTIYKSIEQKNPGIVNTL